jgi:hypothetical protein
MGNYSITAKVKHANGRPERSLTTVYSPMIDSEKLTFLSELQDIRQSRARPWLLSGDFNMIY